MKYAFITSALALASTVVAQAPPSYKSNNGNVEASPVGGNKPAHNGAQIPPSYRSNNGNVEASPVGGNKPAQNGGNVDVDPIANSRPVGSHPNGNGQPKRPQGYGNNVQASPVGGRPNNNRPQQNHPVRPMPGRQQDPVRPGNNKPGGYQNKGVDNKPSDTLASPVGGQGANNAPQGLRSTCLTEQEARQFVERFSGVLDQTGSDLGDTNVTARALVAEDFVEYSNSILSVQGLPTGDGIAAKDKDTWVNGITHAPASRGIETLDVTLSCDVIYWHWVFNQVGSGQYPVKGFNRFEVSRTGLDAENIQAHRMDLEFDSIAWGLNGQIQSCTFPDGRVIGADATESAPASRES